MGPSTHQLYRKETQPSQLEEAVFVMSASHCILDQAYAAIPKEIGKTPKVKILVTPLLMITITNIWNRFPYSQ